MKTLPTDLRRRILDTYDKGRSTREEVAARYGVSVGMVKKLLQQRRQRGDITPQHHRSGRKPAITEQHQRQMRAVLKSRPHATLEELRKTTGLQCTLPAIHHALAKMGLRKKRTPAAGKGSGVSPKRITGRAAAGVKAGTVRQKRNAASASRAKEASRPA